MNRIRIALVFTIAITCGGGLAYGTYNYLQQVPVRTVNAPTRPVVVAAANLSLGTELKPADLDVTEWPADWVPDGSFSAIDEVAGRGLIASVVRGEPFLPGKLAARGAGAGLPPIIPEGMRAMSVRVNEVIGVAGYVLPGTHVDVLATASPTDKREDTTTKLVLSNVQVLAAGTRMERDQDGGEPMSVTVVTLQVTPESAEWLTLASTEGKIQLALRNPMDQSAPETTGIRPAVLLGIPRPAPRPVVRRAPEPPPPPPPPTVEVIRGDVRETAIVR
jgi:pilus assembly protein CpaB